MQVTPLNLEHSKAVVVSHDKENASQQINLLEMAIKLLPFEQLALAFREIEKIFQFVGSQLQILHKNSPIHCYAKKESGLDRKVVIDKQNNRFFILSNNKDGVLVKTPRKVVKEAIQVSLDTQKADRFVQIKGIEQEEASLLEQFSGLKTTTVEPVVLQEAGIDLYTIANYEPELPLSQKKAILLHLANHIRYLHSNGLIHHDIKLQNVIVTKDNKVAIIDFDRSHYAKTAKYYSDQYGTSLYTAPEIVAESNRLRSYQKQEEAEEMFALGCLTYEFIYKKSIPWGETVRKALNFQAREETALACHREHYQALCSAMKQEQCEEKRGLLKVMVGLLDPDPATRWGIAQVIEKLS